MRPGHGRLDRAARSLENFAMPTALRRGRRTGMGMLRRIRTITAGLCDARAVFSAQLVGQPIEAKRAWHAFRWPEIGLPNATSCRRAPRACRTEFRPGRPLRPPLSGAQRRGRSSPPMGPPHALRRAVRATSAATSSSGPTRRGLDSGSLSRFPLISAPAPYLACERSLEGIARRPAESLMSRALALWAAQQRAASSSIWDGRPSSAGIDRAVDSAASIAFGIRRRVDRRTLSDQAAIA